MKIDNLDVDQVINSTRERLAAESDISPALVAAIETLLLLVSLLIARLGLNSNNSSKPPSTDPNRPRARNGGQGKRRPGGQPGHVGTTLMPVTDPDVIVELPLDRRMLPVGCNWRQTGVETRQVFDIVLRREVTEYRAQVWVDDSGQRCVAAFPANVNARVQYGSTCKAHAVYLSQYQLLPYEHVREVFADQYGVALSAGTLARFNREAFEPLAPFEQALKTRLAGQALLHADEAGVNIVARRVWLHTACNTSSRIMPFTPNVARRR